MIHRLAAALVFCVAALFAAAQGDVCGTWRILSSGAEFSVTHSPTQADVYLLAMEHSPDMSVLPGTPIGEMRRTATPGRFVATMCATPGKLFAKKRNLVISLNANGSMRFEPYSKGKRITLWRWIPYFFRVTVRDPLKPPSDIEGAVRVGAQDLTRHRVL